MNETTTPPIVLNWKDESTHPEYYTRIKAVYNGHFYAEIISSGMIRQARIFGGEVLIYEDIFDTEEWFAEKWCAKHLTNLITPIS